jgi:hypothetical protein
LFFQAIRFDSDPQSFPAPSRQCKGGFAIVPVDQGVIAKTTTGDDLNPVTETVIGLDDSNHFLHSGGLIYT